MANNKGLTAAALKRINHHELFRPIDLKMISPGNLVRRLLDYGLTENVKPGVYRVKNEVKDIVTAYKDKVSEAMSKKKGRPLSAAAKEFPQEPRFKLVPWSDGSVLIMIGNKKFLAREVTLVEKS